MSPCRPDSSGFEHVFVGETRGRRTVIGFHNWIQLYLQEKLGHIDYKGYSVNSQSPQVGREVFVVLSHYVHSYPHVWPPLLSHPLRAAKRGSLALIFALAY